MAGLVLGIRYLTGYAVATDPASRDAAEWPPHPGRVFMALAAAHFETGENPAERAALEWIETLGPPALAVSDADRRTVVPVFVPVNDAAGPSRTPLQSAPQFARDRAGRTFPCVRPHEDTLFLIWRDAEPTPVQRQALAELCAKVIRIGHSSSFVQTWVSETPADVEPTLMPADGASDTALRQATVGTLAYLCQQYNADAIGNFERLSDLVTTSRGKAQREAKAEFLRVFGTEWRKALPAPASRRPTLGVSQGYRWVGPRTIEAAEESIFDPALLVMRLDPRDSSYRQLDLTTTLRLTDVLRRAALRVALDDLKLEVVPEVLSGHRADGRPAERPHLAYLPLPFVGHLQADGHLLGMAVAMPQDQHWPEHPKERAVVLAVLSRVTELTLGPLGVWRLVPELRETPPYGLLPGTWTAYPHGERLWASVTPVAFDTHPKEKERGRHVEAVTAMVREACTRVGVPEPVDVRVTPVSAHLGAPTSRDYPRLRRNDGSMRRHTHVVLEFPRPVVGPVLLGAGRYRGYGLCRPLGNIQ